MNTPIDGLGDNLWEDLAKGFMTVSDYAAAVESRDLPRHGQWEDDRKFQAQNPDHPLAMDNRFPRIAAADRLRDYKDKLPQEVLNKAHAHLFDCCAAVRLSLVQAVMHSDSETSIPFLKRLADTEAESQQVKNMARIALTKLATPDRYMDNGQQVYIGDNIGGIPNGKGQMYWSGTAELIYEGEFKDGKFHGTGRKVNDDGTISEGEFRNGKFVG